MEFVAGFLLALAVGLGAHVLRFDRDRSFYPTILIVIASYDLLFAFMADARNALSAELLVFAGFALLAVLGARRWPLLVVAGLVGHAIFDGVHDQFITNPGVPAWWPGFCLAYDLAAAACCGAQILARRASATQEPTPT